VAVAAAVVHILPTIGRMKIATRANERRARGKARCCLLGLLET
jgi:hypothetical protein